MFERYTEDARRSIYFARAEALQRNSRQIETADLVLGISDLTPDETSPVRQVCDRCAAIRSAFGVEPRLTQTPNGTQEIPLSRNSKIALGYAVHEARRDLRFAIGPEHLLRGVLRVGDDTKRSLAAFDIKLPRLRKHSRLYHRKAPDMPVAFRWWFREYRGFLFIAVFAVVLVATVTYLHLQN